MLSTLAAAVLVSPWIGVPLAALTMLIIAVHAAGLTRAAMPESRRRIRLVNGMLMLVTTPIVAYAFSVATPSRQREFLLVWMAVISLLALIVMLALLDMLNNARLHRRARVELRRQIRETRAELVAALASGRRSGRHAERDGNGRDG